MKRSDTLVIDVGVPARTAAEQMRAFHLMLQEVLQNRMEALRDEAETIGNDMEALVGRLEDEGHEAQLEDIKSARWYRTAAQFAMAKKIYTSWCQITGRSEDVVRMEPKDSSDDEPGPESTTDEP